jgi:hypothetical protein
MGLFDNLSWRHRRLPEYGKCYFQHVIATLVSTAPAEAEWPQTIREIVARFREHHEAQWGELCLLEKFTLSKQSDDSVKRRAWALRSAYFDLTGAGSYEKYLQSHPPSENDPNCDVLSLRADLDRVLDSLHWNYALIPIRERLRTSIVRDVGLSVALFVVIDLLLIVWCSYFNDEELFATLLIAMLAGATGGFISLQQRVQNIPTQGDPLISIFELENGRFSIFQAPISGSIFAVLLFFLFMGELVSGGIFPNFHGLNFALHNFKWKTDSPLLGPNYAKLIVWCFIAGFAERFVPDTLDRLIAKSRDTSGSGAPPPQPAPPFPTSTQSPPSLPGAGLRNVSSPPRSLSSPPSPWR